MLLEGSPRNYSVKRKRFESVCLPHLTTSPTLRELPSFVCIHHPGKPLGGPASTRHTGVPSESQQGSAAMPLLWLVLFAALVAKNRTAQGTFVGSLGRTVPKHSKMS